MRRIRFAAITTAIAIPLILGGCGIIGDPAETPPATTGVIHGRALVEGAAAHGDIVVVLQRTVAGAPASVWAAAHGAPIVTERDGVVVGEQSTTTDPDGAYTFAGLEPGTYTVFAQAEHSLVGFVAGIEARAGVETEAADLLLTPTGSIAGVVTMEGAGDHAGAVVFVAGTSLAAFTDAAGAFAIAAVPAGTHALMAARWDYATAAIGEVEVTMGETTTVPTFELELLPEAAPRVVHTFPAQGAVARIPDRPLLAEYSGDVLVLMLQFSNAMVWETVLERVTLEPAVEHSIELLSDALLIHTSTDWEPDYLRFHTDYTVTLAAGALDIFGNATPEPFALSFTTGGLEIHYARPAPGDTIAAVRWQRITLRPNAPLDPEHWQSAETVTFDPPISGIWEPNYDGSPSYFEPDPVLRPYTDYLVSVDGLRDVRGTELDEPLVYTFHTGPVRLLSIVPDDGAEGYPCDEAFVLEFSAEMAFGDGVPEIAIDPPLALLQYGGGGSGNGRRYGFRPDRESDARFWPAATEFTVTLAPEMSGWYGDPLENPTSFSFTTAPFGLVRSWPWDGETGVGRSQYVTLEFDNVVDPSSVVESISISPPMNFNAYVVDYHDVRVVNHLLWEPGTEYTITISTGLQTDTGAPLAEETSISFTVEGI